MIPRAFKLMAVGFLAIVALPLAHGGDILLNGDFSDGKTHWHGDGDAPDTGGRLVITLKPDKWSIVYQDFNAESAQLRIKITYSLSDDCSLVAKKSDDAMVPPLTADGFEDATGLQTGISNVTLSGDESWMVLVISGGWLQQENPVFIKPGSNPRTFTATLSQWSGHFINDSLCLAFPPGQGTVTITKVELIGPKTSP
jgi:hypothetical protein